MTTNADSPPQVTQEFLRIMALPRRSWDQVSDAEKEDLRLKMTAMLKTPNGTMQLRLIQAIALFEMFDTQGLFTAIAVAGGKTLTSLLAFTVLGAQRPLLLVPAKLVEKTKRAWKELSYHWKIQSNIRICSSELMGRVQTAKLLEDYRPDVIVADEAHAYKDVSSARTKRMDRNFKQRPETIYVDLTGTLAKRSITDYAHRVRWAVKRNCPLPLHFTDLEAWASVLDEPSGAWRQERGEIDPGALIHLCTAEERGRGLAGIRSAYRRRLIETPGVIVTTDSGTGIPIVVDILRPRVPADVQDAVREMRDTWATPDGQPFLDAIAMWRHCREMALGFFYHWVPEPPTYWKDVRKTWAAWSRYIIQNGRRNCDSELQVMLAVDAGHYPDAAPALAAWRAVKDTYVPSTQPVWISDYALDYITDQLHSDPPALVWVEHTAFGERLAAKSGLPYYGRNARTKEGRSILDHPRGRHAIVSIKSVGEGFDLQYFSRNIYVSFPTNGPQVEQTLGRTDREGQKADSISASILIACSEHVSAVKQAMADAQYIEETTGMQQKILKADWSEEL